MNIENKQALITKLNTLLTKFNIGIVTITVKFENDISGYIVTQCFDFCFQDGYCVRLFNHEAENCSFSFDIVIDKIVKVEDDSIDSNDIDVSIQLQDGLEFILHKDQ
jgi:hypothetical protein